MRGVRYVLVCAGVRCVQSRLTGAHVRLFGTGVQFLLLVAGVIACAARGMCWYVRACNFVQDRLRGFHVR